MSSSPRPPSSGLPVESLPVPALLIDAVVARRNIDRLARSAVGARRPQIGERVTVIPNHIGPCVNLCDVFWWCGPGGEAVSVTVNARGMLS